jgi:hypothetical protein
MFPNDSGLPERFGKIERTLGAGELVNLQPLGDGAAERHRAMTGGGLRCTNLVEPVGALPDVELIGIKVYVVPAEAAKL